MEEDHWYFAALSVDFLTGRIFFAIDDEYGTNKKVSQQYRFVKEDEEGGGFF